MGNKISAIRKKTWFVKFVPRWVRLQAIEQRLIHYAQLSIFHYKEYERLRNSGQVVYGNHLRLKEVYRRAQLRVLKVLYKHENT